MMVELDKILQFYLENFKQKCCFSGRNDFFSKSW